jgi:hypothetical protein
MTIFHVKRRGSKKRANAAKGRALKRDLRLQAEREAIEARNFARHNLPPATFGLASG